ncbi:MAG: LamG-like jellyroll fold domain-containing protein, partial [Gammaproteobacteria bacterium]
MKIRTCLAAALVFALPSFAFAADPVAGLGTALNLESSTSDGVEVADDAAFDIGTGSFTIEAWTKRSSVTGGFYTIAAKQQNAGWYFRLNGSTLNFTTAFDSSSGNSVSAASDITDTNWHHVVGVHDASAKTLSIYIDGVLSNSLTYSSAANVDNTYALGIGFKPGWGEYFDGSLDEIRFWNTARTAAQIREYMNTPLAGNEAGLVGYWNLEEGSGTSLANRSGTSGPGGTLKNPDSNEWITGNISYSATTNEDVNVSLRLGGSDTDSQSSATAVITDLPDHGALYQTNDGSTSGTQISAISTALTDSGGNPRRVIFVPAANYNGSDSFSYKVNDGTTDSANTVTVNLSIAAVADAPTATNLTQSKSATEGGGAIALDDIVVTDGDSGETITATLTLSSTSAGSLSTGTYGSATSTFNAGTGVWTVTGSVSDVNAALAAVAFTPSANNDQNFTITTRIRDAASTGPADGTISVTVTATNDAPLLNTTPVLRFTANEDAGAPVNGVASGTLVSAFTGGITDVDTGASKGIAIVFADATKGTWWYSVDAGTTWSTLGTPSAGAARLLASDARLHFEPTADWNGTVTPGLTIRAWDASTGTNGDTGNITSTGGSTAYSVASDTVVLAVNAVNDAPTATNLTQSKSVTEGGGAVALDDIVVSDGDSGDTITATLTLSSTSAGSLSTGTYGSATSTFNAGTGVWTVTGSVSDVNAALAAVAFTPSANNDQNFTITTQIRDAADSGPANGTISFTVTAVNDNPAATGLPASLSYTEDTQGNFDVSASTFSDVDSTNVTVVFTASAGTFGLAASGGITLTTLSGNGTGTITIAGTIANVNQYLDTASNVTFRPAENASGSPAATVTVTANDGNGSGNVTAGTIDINVTSVNDAPTLTATGLDPTFGEGGSAVDLFGTVTASTVDSTQTFSALTLTVTNVSNGTGEILAIGGTDVALTNGNSGTLTGIGTFSVSVASGTATVSVSGMTRDNTQISTLVDGITYRNTATPPGTTARVVTLTSIQDSGGTANGGVDSTTISLASTVTIDLAPTVSSSNRNSPSGSKTNASSVVYRVTFSETVTGVDTADFTLTMTGTANGSVASVSAVSGSVYDVTVNAVSGDGTLRLDLKNTGTGIVDAAT